MPNPKLPRFIPALLLLVLFARTALPQQHEQKALPAEKRNALKFNFGTEEWRYVYEHSPESASAYDESYILSLLGKHGLRLRAPIYYGHWSGREAGLSFQDMLIIERA